MTGFLIHQSAQQPRKVNTASRVRQLWVWFWLCHIIPEGPWASYFLNYNFFQLKTGTKMYLKWGRDLKQQDVIPEVVYHINVLFFSWPLILKWSGTEGFEVETCMLPISGSRLLPGHSGELHFPASLELARTLWPVLANESCVAEYCHHTVPVCPVSALLARFSQCSFSCALPQQSLLTRPLLFFFLWISVNSWRPARM